MEQIYLSEDLITEILSRLPVKSVVGFKIVSKTWNNLISKVCIPRILRAPSPLCGFLFPSTQDSIGYISYSDNEECGNDGEGFAQSLTSLLPSESLPYALIDCCNGLILLGSSLSKHRYYVCNPLTKQCVAIPKAREDVLASPPALAFHPCDSSHYKIIRFLRARMDPEVDIFSSENKTWITRKVSVKPRRPVSFYVLQSVYSRGGILYNLTYRSTILRYNIEALSEAEIIEVPDKNNHPCDSEVIGLCKGALNYASRNQSTLLIWQLDDHRHHSNSHGSNKAASGARSWILKHSICMDEWGNKLHVFGLTRFYNIHPNSDIIFLGSCDMIYRYHLKTNKMELFSTRSVGKEFSFASSYFWPYSQCCINILNDFDHLK
ncbi:F-box domain-containing protein [Citrus sinensis]|nr:F-box domain-containing protein [Citrus sinensis]